MWRTYCRVRRSFCLMRRWRNTTRNRFNKLGLLLNKCRHLKSEKTLGVLARKSQIMLWCFLSYQLRHRCSDSPGDCCWQPTDIINWRPRFAFAVLTILSPLRISEIKWSFWQLLLYYFIPGYCCTKSVLAINVILPDGISFLNPRPSFSCSIIPW